MNATHNQAQEPDKETIVAPDIEAFCELPIVLEAKSLLSACLLTKTIGAIVGPNGCGKTVALKILETSQVEGAVFRMRCCQQEGASRGVRDILMEMGAAGVFNTANQSMPLALLCKLALRAFQQRNIRVLLLDEADLWDARALGGLVTMLDVVADKGHAVSAILTGMLPPEQWLQQVPALDSRTLHTVRAKNLSLADMLGLLDSWGGGFSGLVEAFQLGDINAQNIAEDIHSATGGNPRRLYYVAKILLSRGQKISFAGVRRAIQETSR